MQLTVIVINDDYLFVTNVNKSIRKWQSYKELLKSFQNINSLLGIYLGLLLLKTSRFCR